MSAFDEIFRRYHQDIFRYCRSIVRNEQDALDALQNTMAQAIARLPGESREIKLKPWLFTVARNECIDSLNRRRDQVSSEAIEFESGSNVERDVSDRERLRRVLSDIGRLPEAQRSALVMRELNGLSFEEIGLVIECSPQAARQSVYEARMSLRELESGRDMLCDEARQAISSMDGRVLRGRRLRAHLRSCQECQDFRLGLRSRQEDLRSLVPVLPVAVAASVLGSIGGGGGGGLGGGLLAMFGGGGAAAGTGAKAAAIVAVTAAVGAGTVGVVDRVGQPGSDQKPSASSRPDSGDSSLPPALPAVEVSGTGGQPQAVPADAARNQRRAIPGSTAANRPPGLVAGDPAQNGQDPGAPVAGDFDPGSGSAEGSERGSSASAPGHSSDGPPGQGAGRPAGVGGGPSAGATNGPPDHVQGQQGGGPPAPATKPSTGAGSSGSSSNGSPSSSGSGKPPGGKPSGKPAGTP
jgi:RNA polymerase sigma factor (sigma-70 family)